MPAMNGGLPRMASDQKIFGMRSKNTPIPPRMLSFPCFVGSQAKLRRGAKYPILWFAINFGTIPTEAPAILSTRVDPEPSRIVDIWPDCSLGLELKSQRKPRFREKLGFSFQSS